MCKGKVNKQETFGKVLPPSIFNTIHHQSNLKILFCRNLFCETLIDPILSSHLTKMASERRWIKEIRSGLYQIKIRNMAVTLMEATIDLNDNEFISRAHNSNWIGSKDNSWRTYLTSKRRSVRTSSLLSVLILGIHYWSQIKTDKLLKCNDCN